MALGGGAALANQTSDVAGQARHHRRRRHGPADQARDQALPARQRPDRATASSARRRSRALGLDTTSTAPRRGVLARASGVLERIAAVRVRRRPDRGLLHRPVPRQVPVQPRARGAPTAARATRPPLPRPTQDRIAAKLYAAEGTAPWPVCGPVATSKRMDLRRRRASAAARDGAPRRRPRWRGRPCETTVSEPTTALSPVTSSRAGSTRRSRSTRCGRRARRACRCPARAIGRSDSTTPWSKSISITRSATMHSRPIETCWNAEIVHSWPMTVLAPISTTPSCARILVPWPIHDQRPSRTTAFGPISKVTSGRDEAQAVRLQPAAPAQLQPQPSAASAARTWR